MKWSGAQDRRLKELVERGLSAAQIGTEMRLSRSSVIGRCHRTGLQLSGLRVYPDKPGPKRGTARKAPLNVKEVAARREAAARLWRGAAGRADAPVADAMVFPETRGAAKAVVAQAARQCKWPLGDPASDDFHFCTAERADRRYCAAHRAMAVRA